VLNSALAGEKASMLNVTVKELLAEPLAVADAFWGALERPGVGLMGHWMIHELLRRSNLHDDLVDALASPDPLTRAAAARICGASRLSEALPWIADLIQDPDPRVRDSAVRAMAQVGGSRAVEVLVERSDSIPLYRLAIALSLAASDVDVESLLRRPKDERMALAAVLACGLRRDVLRVSGLLGIAHDRRWPNRVRVAAAKALALIADRSAADGLKRMAETEPDPTVKAAAERAYRRLIRRAVRMPR
jgi:HEAT repeat protein